MSCIFNNEAMIDPCPKLYTHIFHKRWLIIYTWLRNLVDATLTIFLYIYLPDCACYKESLKHNYNTKEILICAGATPKLVLQLMNVRGLSIAHVKSHLQVLNKEMKGVYDFENIDKN